jgi:hypothetical protein
MKTAAMPPERSSNLPANAFKRHWVQTDLEHGLPGALPAAFRHVQHAGPFA